MQNKRENEIVKAFKNAYPELIKKGLIVRGTAELMGVDVLRVCHPIIFDSRVLPERFRGYDIRSSICAEYELPIEFRIDKSNPTWYKHEFPGAPERYIKFVNRCADEIREKLGNPTMTKEEMLDALYGGDFKKYQVRISRKIAAGELPPYKEY